MIRLPALIVISFALTIALMFQNCSSDLAVNSEIALRSQSSALGFIEKNSTPVDRVYVNPYNSSEMFAIFSADEVILKTDDAGTSWRVICRDEQVRSDIRIMFSSDPANPAVATSYYYSFWLYDRGCSRIPTTRYRRLIEYSPDGTLYMWHSDGLKVTRDRGASWEIMSDISSTNGKMCTTSNNELLTIHSTTALGVTLNERKIAERPSGVSTSSSQLYNIVCHPTSNRVYQPYSGYLSEDGGVTFEYDFELRYGAFGPNNRIYKIVTSPTPQIVSADDLSDLDNIIWEDRMFVFPDEMSITSSNRKFDVALDGSVTITNIDGRVWNATESFPEFREITPELEEANPRVQDALESEDYYYILSDGRLYRSPKGEWSFQLLYEFSESNLISEGRLFDTGNGLLVYSYYGGIDRIYWAQHGNTDFANLTCDDATNCTSTVNSNNLRHPVKKSNGEWFVQNSSSGIVWHATDNSLQRMENLNTYPHRTQLRSGYRAILFDSALGDGAFHHFFNYEHYLVNIATLDMPESLYEALPFEDLAGIYQDSENTALAISTRGKSALFNIQNRTWQVLNEERSLGYAYSRHIVRSKANPQLVVTTSTSNTTGAGVSYNGGKTWMPLSIARDKCSQVSSLSLLGNTLILSCDEKPAQVIELIK